MKNFRKITLILILVVIFTGCADIISVEDCVNSEPYGFWSGLWHGWIILFSWIGSLFSNDIAAYAVNNTGGWYDFGSILGLGTLTRGASKL